MNKQEYLSAIRMRIPKMPTEDMERFIAYYSEMIDDRVEDGMTEEEAVASMDAPDEAVDQILADTPLTKIVKQKMKPTHRLRAWEIVLLVLGSPVWIPLLLAAGILVLSMVVVVFSLLLTFYAVVVTVAVAGIAGTLAVIPFLMISNIPAAVFMLGCGFAGVGLTILFVVAVKPVTIGFWNLCKAAVSGIKRKFVRGGSIMNEVNDLGCDRRSAAE